MSCSLTLQICLIIALSFHCRHWRFGFVISQVSLAWSNALHTQELYMGSRVLKERWREERTGSSSMNFFQAVFTPVVVESSQPLAAESMSQVAKGSYHLQRVRSDGLPSVVCLPRGMQFTGTVRICNRSFVNGLSPLHFLFTSCLQPFQKMLLLPTPVRQTAH